MSSNFLQDFLQLLSLLRISSIAEGGSALQSPRVSLTSSHQDGTLGSTRYSSEVFLTELNSTETLIDEKTTHSIQTTSQASRREFQLPNLPVELGLEILVQASSHSQSTYLSLLLTCHSFHNLIRLEAIPFLPITLTTKKQLSSFAALVTKDPEFASRVRHLWMITEVGNRQAWSTILERCTSILSFACLPEMLLGIDVSTRHTELRDLTIQEMLPLWVNQKIYDQIESLHIIEGGGGDWTQRLSSYTIPRFPHLHSVSISLGTRYWLPQGRFQNWIHAEKLKQLAFVSRAHKAAYVSLLAADVDACQNTRYSVSLVHAPKRLSEMKLWKARVCDKDAVWKLKSAKAVFGMASS